MDTYLQFMRNMQFFLFLSFLPPYSCNVYDDGGDKPLHTKKYPSESEFYKLLDSQFLLNYRLVVCG